MDEEQVLPLGLTATWNKEWEHALTGELPATDEAQKAFSSGFSFSP